MVHHDRFRCAGDWHAFSQREDVRLQVMEKAPTLALLPRLCHGDFSCSRPCFDVPRCPA